MALIETSKLRKRYGDAETGRVALDGVSLSVERGEMVAVLGTSGSGKSTLLHVVGGLDVAYEGSVKVDGQELKALSDARLSSLRQRALGFVFQSFHLVPSWRVSQNVALPATFAPTAVPNLDGRVREVLARVGLAGRENDFPTSLSGGQRQRVAIARALLLKPTILLCDEPTGSLDVATGQQILDLFKELHAEGDLTLILITHEERAAAIAERIVKLERGAIVSDEKRTPASGERPAAEARSEERGEAGAS
jgi:putative ABC transport system ATP-binding protein